MHWSLSIFPKIQSHRTVCTVLPVHAFKCLAKDQPRPWDKLAACAGLVSIDETPDRLNFEPAIEEEENPVTWGGGHLISNMARA